MEFLRPDTIRIQTRIKNTSHSYITSKKRYRQRVPVLLLHGAGGGAWYWEDTIHYLTSAGGYHSYAPDLPGHGARSDERIITKGIHAYTEYIATFIAHVMQPVHGGHLPIIVGHSMGGLIAQKLAERGLAHKVVLLASAPPKEVGLSLGKEFRIPHADYYAGIRSIFTRKPFQPSRGFVSALFVDPEKSAEAIDRCTGLMVYESPRAMLELAMARVSVDRTRVTIPMLIMGFVQDSLITEHVVRRTAQYYGAVPAGLDEHPTRELCIRPDLGHMCPIEHGWEQVVKKYMAWMA